MWWIFRQNLQNYMLDLKAGFPLKNFSHKATFFIPKQWKVELDSTFFTLEKVANQQEFSKKSLCTTSGKPA